MGDHSHHGGHDHGGHGGHDLDPVEHRADPFGGIDISSIAPEAPGGHEHNHGVGFGGAGGANGSLHSMMMHMFFHFGKKETILFEGWETTEEWGLFGSMLAIFVLAFIYEALKFYREHLYRRSFRTIQYNTVTIPVENGGTVKETQKTVQIGGQSLSVDPNFQPSEITPIFISQNTCNCPASTSLNMDCKEDPPPAVSESYTEPINNNFPSRSQSRGGPLPIPTSVHHAYKVRMMSWMHTWQTTLHMLQVILSYFLMLIFMTYNVWLCLAVVLGAGAGYFFFGWKKSLVVDITEHCH